MADFGTVARPYARAIFDTAVEGNDLEGWSRALEAAAAVTADKAAHDWLKQPARSDEERCDFVVSLAAELPGAGVVQSQAGRNLLRLLSENDRLDALGEISEQFEKLKAARENRISVTLVAASAVDAAQADSVASALGRKLGRDVELKLEVDESLLGGAIVRAQDMVIDDSLKTRLARLTSSLID
jgi:F-type H+-transporting ATPase subunit delta